MKGVLIKGWYLWIVCALSTTPLANALEVNDPEHGFRFTVPDEFVRDAELEDPKTLHQFRLAPKEPSQLATFIRIQNLEVLIPLGRRVKPSEIPTEKGVEVSFDEIEWQTHKMDVIKSMVTTPQGTKLALYTIHFPLTPKAVQLRVGGPAEKDAEIRALFDKTVTGFANIGPLNTKVQESDAYKFGGLIANVAIWGFVAFVFIRMVARLVSGKKKTPPRPPQSGPPVIRRPR